MDKKEVVTSKSSTQQHRKLTRVKKKKELTIEERKEELEQALDIENKCIEIFIDQIRISRNRTTKIKEQLEELKKDFK